MSGKVVVIVVGCCIVISAGMDFSLMMNVAWLRGRFWSGRCILVVWLARQDLGGERGEMEDVDGWREGNGEIWLILT